MNSLIASCYAESLKVRRSRIVWLTTGALCLAPVFGALFVIVLRNPSLTAGNEALTAKAALTGFSPDWPSFLNLVSQAIGVGGVIVFGFVAGWLFGREYSDKTLKDLFVLPVGRMTVVVSKLIVCIAWCAIITIVVTAVALVVGFLLNLPGWEWGMLRSSLLRIGATALLVVSLCPPVFFVACAGRGYLAPLGFVVLTVVFAQIIGALGFGAYVPWAVPALYSGLGSEAGGTTGGVSYLIVVLTGVAGLVATVYRWKYADQTK